MAMLPKSGTSRDIEATFFYAGEIIGRGRFDIPNPERNNIAFAPADVTVLDVRPMRDSMKLDEAGFTFAKHRSAFATDPALFEQNLSHQMNARGASAAYEAEVGAFLKGLTGARDVLPQVSGLLARTSSRSQVKSWATPANFVHLDFTEKTARQFLDLSLAAHGPAIKPYRRFAVYQTWRAISSGPQDNTLAICDGSSVPPEDAVVIDSVVGPEDVPGAFFESRLCKPRDSHLWYYLPNMEPDDLLVFKGFDSDVPNAMNAMHTAFDNPEAGDGAPPRRSLEARFFALFY